MRIRDATAQDLEPITNLIIRCSEKFILPDFPAEGVQAYMSSHSIEKMKERLDQFDYKVLEDEKGNLIGAVGMQNNTHLYHLHVAPEFHGRGYGQKLWDAAKDAALAKGEGKGFTVNSSRYAVPFYEKLGFISGRAQTSNGVTYFPMKMAI